MGAANSKSPGYSSRNPFTGSHWKAPHGNAQPMLRRAGWGTQAKCQSKPRYADARGWALTTIYGVPENLLDRYPPTVYSVQQALEDIEACKKGANLPHFRQVVRYDKVVGGRDPRVYALVKYHGYRASNFDDPRVLQLLPYSEKDAQIDISYYQKRGRPYYTVIKHTSTVLDPKTGTVRDWRHRGFDNKYRYDVYDPKGAGARIEKLGAKVKTRLDVSKYPKKKVGGRWVRMVPCRELPAMCRPGDTVFPYAGGDDKSNAVLNILEAKKRKIQERRAAVEHSRKMDQLTRRMQGLNKNSDKYKALKAQRDALSKKTQRRRQRQQRHFNEKLKNASKVYDTV